MFALAAMLPAQQIVLRAPSIEAAWCGHDGVLRAQTGRRVVVFDVPVRSVALPDDAVAFDHLADVFGVTSDPFRAASAATRQGGGAPQAARGVPLRVPLFAGRRHVLSPGATTVHAYDLDSRTDLDLAIRPRRARERGFGLSGRIVDEVAFPHVLAFERDGALVVVAQEPDGGYVCIRGATRRKLPAVDVVEGGALEGFELLVPPLLADVDGDHVPDLVRADPVRGVVVVQGGLLAETMPAPRVIVLKTPLLAIDATDMTNDGVSDLVVLKIAPLTPLQQLSILTSSKIDATALVYAFTSAETSSSTPIASVDIEIGVAIVVRDAVRRADVLDLVACAAGRILLATPGARAKLISLDGKKTEIGVVPSGSWADPLRPARLRGTILGVLNGAGVATLIRFDL